MLRLPLLLTALTCLGACASAPERSHPWWKSLAGVEAPPEDVRACRGVRSADELDRLSGCGNPGQAALSPTEVVGLETLPRALRDCALADLPAPEASGEQSPRCQQQVADVLESRLSRLGWVRADALTPAEAGTPPPSSGPRLTIRLGERHRIGRLFVATDVNPKVSAKRIEKQARKAIPKDRWCTQAALDEIRLRIADMARFQAIQVNRGAPDDEQATVPVVIDVKE